MILGIGTDICDIRRINKIYNGFGDSFLKRVYSDYEIDVFRNLTSCLRVPFLAKRFAAKEACSKALGTGFGKSAFMKEISIEKKCDTPIVRLYGNALYTANNISNGKNYDLLISLSDEKQYAQAFCIFTLVT